MKLQKEENKENFENETVQNYYNYDFENETSRNSYNLESENTVTINCPVEYLNRQRTQSESLYVFPPTSQDDNLLCESEDSIWCGEMDVAILKGKPKFSEGMYLTGFVPAVDYDMETLDKNYKKLLIGFQKCFKYVLTDYRTQVRISEYMAQNYDDLFDLFESLAKCAGNLKKYPLMYAKSCEVIPDCDGVRTHENVLDCSVKYDEYYLSDANDLWISLLFRALPIVLRRIDMSKYLNLCSKYFGNHPDINGSPEKFKLLHCGNSAYFWDDASFKRQFKDCNWRDKVKESFRNRKMEIFSDVQNFVEHKQFETFFDGVLDAYEASPCWECDLVFLVEYFFQTILKFNMVPLEFYDLDNFRSVIDLLDHISNIFGYDDNFADVYFACDILEHKRIFMEKKGVGSQMIGFLTVYHSKFYGIPYDLIKKFDKFLILNTTDKRGKDFIFCQITDLLSGSRTDIIPIWLEDFDYKQLKFDKMNYVASEMNISGNGGWDGEFNNSNVVFSETVTLADLSDYEYLQDKKPNIYETQIQNTPPVIDVADLDKFVNRYNFLESVEKSQLKVRSYTHSSDYCLFTEGLDVKYKINQDGKISDYLKIFSTKTDLLSDIKSKMLASKKNAPKCLRFTFDGMSLGKFCSMTLHYILYRNLSFHTKYFHSINKNVILTDKVNDVLEGFKAELVEERERYESNGTFYGWQCDNDDFVFVLIKMGGFLKKLVSKFGYLVLYELVFYGVGLIIGGVKTVQHEGKSINVLREKSNSMYLHVSNPSMNTEYNKILNYELVACTIVVTGLNSSRIMNNPNEFVEGLKARNKKRNFNISQLNLQNNLVIYSSLPPNLNITPNGFRYIPSLFSCTQAYRNQIKENEELLLYYLCFYGVFIWGVDATRIMGKEISTVDSFEINFENCYANFDFLDRLVAKTNLKIGDAKERFEINMRLARENLHKMCVVNDDINLNISRHLKKVMDKSFISPTSVFSGFCSELFESEQSQTSAMLDPEIFLDLNIKCYNKMIRQFYQKIKNFCDKFRISSEFIFGKKRVDFDFVYSLLDNFVLYKSSTAARSRVFVIYLGALLGIMRISMIGAGVYAGKSTSTKKIEDCEKIENPKFSLVECFKEAYSNTVSETLNKATGILLTGESNTGKSHWINMISNLLLPLNSASKNLRKSRGGPSRVSYPSKRLSYCVHEQEDQSLFIDNFKILEVDTSALYKSDARARPNVIMDLITFVDCSDWDSLENFLEPSGLGKRDFDTTQTFKQIVNRYVLVNLSDDYAKKYSQFSKIWSFAVNSLYYVMEDFKGTTLANNIFSGEYVLDADFCKIMSIFYNVNCPEKTSFSEFIKIFKTYSDEYLWWSIFGNGLSNSEMCHSELRDCDLADDDFWDGVINK